MDKNDDAIQILHVALVKLLRPLVRLCLKKQVSYGTFSMLVKWLFFDVARKEFIIEGRKQTHSRISVITGFSRKEVKRLSDLPPPTDSDQGEKYNRVVQVVSGWLRDQDFIDKRGRPRSIYKSGEGATFDELVKRYSGDMPARAVLDELLRTGAVKMMRRDRIRLMKDAYVPKNDDANMFFILGNDVGSLISTITHNIDANGCEPFFQRKVSYDNIPGKFMPKVREITGRKSNKLLNDLDKFLSSKDRDANPKIKGDGRYEAGIGIFYFEKPKG